MNDRQPQTTENLPATTDSLSEVKARVKEKLNGHVWPSTNPSSVWSRADRELMKGLPECGISLSIENPVIQAMTIEEFNFGILMNLGIPDMYKAFSMELSAKIQDEYKCNTESKKATAHLAAQSYCRILDLQRRMHNYLNQPSYTKTGLKLVDVLSREMDRAQRHYYNAIQTLSIVGQAPVTITVKTKQANIGQNVIAKQDNEYESK